MPKDAAPACSSAFAGDTVTPELEKKLAKSTVGPLMPEFRPPVQSTCATFFPARSAAAASVSAWRMPGVANEVRLSNASPGRWKVLLVDLCSPQVPVASVYQPTPMFGGSPCVSPLSPLTPVRISCA